MESGQRVLHLPDAICVDLVIDCVCGELPAGDHEGQDVSLVCRISDGDETNAGIVREGTELCTFLRSEESGSSHLRV